MTDTDPVDQPADATEPLPVVVKVSTAFAARAPSQRVIDSITRMQGGTFGEWAQAMPFRLTAFRALLRDYPGRDVRSLWAHAYDVEVELVEVDPTQNGSPTASLASAATTAAFPETLTS